MPLGSMTLTRSQALQLIKETETHPRAIRIESLADAYVRVVLIDAEGQPATERLLFPT
jgi:hypothetical protein